MPNAPIISTQWLSDHLEDDKLRIIDASWRLPGNDDTPAFDAYTERHINGAVFFDIDKIAAQNPAHDNKLDLPHMAPSAHMFEEAMSAFGISNQDSIVVYDDAGLFSAARVWWTFKAMGHMPVYVLDGGLPKWLKENRPVNTRVPEFATSTYKASPSEGAFISHDQIRENAGVPVLDARPAPRFLGEAPEPRPHLRRGHMPGAKNLPFGQLLHSDGTLLPDSILLEQFEALNVTQQTGAMTSCGSGITAAIINLAMEKLGIPQRGLYDGAWAEWGHPENDPNLFPVVKT